MTPVQQQRARLEGHYKPLRARGDESSNRSTSLVPGASHERV